MLKRYEISPACLAKQEFLNQISIISALLIESHFGETSYYVL
ncbi:hypothetical protein [Clostridium sp.]